MNPKSLPFFALFLRSKFFALILRYVQILCSDSLLEVGQIASHISLQIIARSRSDYKSDFASNHCSKSVRLQVRFRFKSLLEFGQIASRSGRRMKQSQDPFEAAFVEQESPPESPAAVNDTETQIDAAATVNDADQPEDEVGLELVAHPNVASTSAAPLASTGVTQPNNKNKDEDDEEEEDNMDVELGKLSSSGDPDKMAKMQTILSRFTEEQMSRYESFRRSGFQRSNMKRLLVSITGSQKISVHMSIVASGIAKMFVGELVETVTNQETTRRGDVTWRRLKLHANTILTKFPSMKINPSGKAFYQHPRLKTIVSKDGNGRLTLYKVDKDEDKDKDKLYRCKFCYLYNELELKSSGVTIKDVWLWFYYYDKGAIERDDDGDDFSNKAHEDDLIMSCLNRGDYSREELKEAVTKILGHINTFHFSHRLGIVQSQSILNKLCDLYM